MQATTQPRVLVVDDNEDAADSEAELLRLVGFEVWACHSGAVALELAREFLPDVCLLDLSMPVMSGDELAARLREQAGTRPLMLVAVTAMSDDEHRRLTEAAGFDLHLIKPVDPHDLLRVVDELWAAWHAADRPEVAPDTDG